MRRINDVNDASRPFKFGNVFDPACTNTTPTNTAIDCTNATLRPDVNPADNSFSFEFADDRFLTPAVNRLMGNLARDRAHNHPF